MLCSNSKKRGLLSTHAITLSWLMILFERRLALFVTYESCDCDYNLIKDYTRPKHGIKSTVGIYTIPKLL